jgi:protein-S-isoprenylcysteine O-methyltransferase Ste14
MLLVLKNLLFTALVPGTVAVYVPLLITQSRSSASGLTLVLAVAVLVLGAAIYCWCVWDFATFGRGTPAPIDAPQKLVVRGLYRFTRNPMYVGVLAVIVGWAMFFRTMNLVLYALSVGICFHLFIVLYEERRLSEAFGSQYAEYCSEVARWLPRPFRGPAA